MNKTIEKKIQPKYFIDILVYKKRFEIRKNDCDYQVGDFVKLLEYDATTKKYTGNYILVEITYVLKDIPEYGLNKDYCIFNFLIHECALNDGEYVMRLRNNFGEIY